MALNNLERSSVDSGKQSNNAKGDGDILIRELYFVA